MSIKPNGNGNGRSALATIVPTIVAIIAGFWVILRLTIDSAIHSSTDQINSKLNEHDAKLITVQVQNTTSISERSELMRKAEIFQKDISILQSNVTQNEERHSQKETEIETQFEEMDKISNLHLAAQMRVDALLWKKSYGEDWPEIVYFPEISKRK